MIVYVHAMQSRKKTQSLRNGVGSRISQRKCVAMTCREDPTKDVPMKLCARVCVSVRRARLRMCVCCDL